MIFRVLFAVVAALISAAVFSQNAECPHQPYEYRLSGSSDLWISSAHAVRMARGAQCVALWNSNENCAGQTVSSLYSYQLLSCNASPDTGNGSCFRKVTRKSDGVVIEESQSFQVNVVRRSTVECPPHPCEGYVGLRAEGGGTGSWGDGDLCRTEDAGGNPIAAGGCRVVRDGPGINTSSGWFGSVRFTGALCASSGDVEVEPDPPDCITGPRGQVCLDKPSPDKSCGTFNGERVCFDKVPDSGCVLLSGGGAVCSADAGPVDEESEPIEPDAVVENVVDGTPVEFNYFGPSTVAGAGAPLVGTGSAGAGGSGVRGPKDSEGETGLPEYDDDWEPGDGIGGAITGLGESGWFGVFAGSVSALSGSSSCPSVTMDVDFMDASFDLLEAACGYMSPHYGLWTTLMQIAWGFLAIRVFFTGGRD